MFEWYRRSAVCFAFLEDVEAVAVGGGDDGDSNGGGDEEDDGDNEGPCSFVLGAARRICNSE